MYARVGPTTFPYVIAAGLAVLAVGTAVSAWRGGFPEREADHAGPILWIVGGLVAQMLLLKTAGFSIATGAALRAAPRAASARGPLWLTVPIGIVFALVVWVIFARAPAALAAGRAARAAHPLSGGAHGHLRPARPRPRPARCSRSTCSTR